jgi:hypothetical protein
MEALETALSIYAEEKSPLTLHPTVPSSCAPGEDPPPLETETETESGQSLDTHILHDTI